ncbi:hypothetical protein PVL29_022743 [Vitis rotundifolia]|uniref:Uncharacterized protein n=1 Tax=Vitis rotundifolia TaxID=103349 RepID=A0AA38YWJ7_VITRO|nr:hypothetical protein PVL29_022743 [Vitis rotundifolia]
MPAGDVPVGGAIAFSAILDAQVRILNGFDVICKYRGLCNVGSPSKCSDFVFIIADMGGVSIVFSASSQLIISMAPVLISTVGSCRSQIHSCCYENGKLENRGWADPGASLAELGGPFVQKWYACWGLSSSTSLPGFFC